ncbi:MAG: winged helix DNA-binding domain-containing protein [Bacillota bacterium]|nr:winged helix DNA-binding domain-containing protein [Bacillota bacterium]
MSKFIITKQQACRFLLKYQGLQQPYKSEGKAGILEYIRRVGCIQFDPLNIAGHNQELVLQSRINSFKPCLLNELLYKDRKLIDAWDKNMSIYLTEDWPFFKRNRDSAWFRFGNENIPIVSVLPQVRNEFKQRGPMSSSDLAFDQTVDWPWAPTRLSRAVLESMYFWGELIIHHKEGTRKIYDLVGSHIPDELLEAHEPNVTPEQYHDWYIERRIGSVGLLWNRSGDAWLGISGINSAERTKAFERLLGGNRIIEVTVEGIKLPLYFKSEYLHLMESVINSDEAASVASIIAPLDNLIWDRQLTKALFNFDYRWEVYKPASERQYGYYVLPVMYKDKFVARFEPGTDKKTGSLIIKNWWWEPGTELSDDMFSALKACFKEFIGFLGLKQTCASKKLIKQETLKGMDLKAVHHQKGIYL